MTSITRSMLDTGPSVRNLSPQLPEGAAKGTHDDNSRESWELLARAIGALLRAGGRPNRLDADGAALPLGGDVDESIQAATPYLPRG